MVCRQPGMVGTPEGQGLVLTMRVLVTGAAGQLGRDLVLHSQACGDDVLGCSHAELDVTDRSAVFGLVASWHPDVVIHAAAWTAVDLCESNPDRAYVANGLAVRWIAEACRQTSAHLVTVSTDYVFDGSLARPYHEWDEPNPASAYGRSKLAGEREALSAGIGAGVVRTSWVCGEHGNNMVKTILRLANEHDHLSFVDDQRGHPTFTQDLATALRRVAIDRRAGLYHITNQGAVSWFEFAQAVMEAAGHEPSRVHPVATKDLRPPRPAPRPVNSVLDNAVARLAGLPPLDDFRVPLQRLVRRLIG